MSRHIYKSRTSTRETYKGKHRFEHWYRDNQIYFITARCRDRFKAFASEQAKAIFWAQFNKYSELHGFAPWVTSLMDNHYHTLGYLARGAELPKMMKRIHGSVAKLVNDRLEVRLVPFWTDHGKQTYFDGCIRDEMQARKAYRYTFTQWVRHHICADPERYPHTRVIVALEDAIADAIQRDAFLAGVPYARYDRHRSAT